ncbi:MFS transporter [Bacillus salacetis]|uniref:MFS transporter n=1 Tax=Bacillus salacetis TaxID=2315464 RepID=A0A3A1QXF4_9BACI|nr:MFS transporter [Bacillus salacetis]RIW30419.1 MFS transporter [Bacillus salacetis]
MKKFSRSFKALWTGEIVSEFGGAAGGIINGLLLFELTGSKEWMGALWLVYFLPSLILQGISAPFLNHVIKERVLKNIQLIRAFSYLLPLLGYLLGSQSAVILGLIVLQCFLGLMQPIYASLSFSLLPQLCRDEELENANGLLDGTIRLMSFLAPGVTSLLLIFMPLPFIYGISAAMFLASYIALSQIPPSNTKEAAVWTKKFWWKEMREGYRTFFQFPQLMRLTILTSTVQFAVGTTLVLSIPYIRRDLQGQSWEYAIFSGAFPVGYALGMLLLNRLPKNPHTMYLGLAGGGFSFVLLFFVHSIPLAWLCELFGGILFPLFNAQNSAIFQREAPRDRLTQLSSVRLLFIRITMPLGVLFASSTLLPVTTRQAYLMIGLIIAIPGLYYLFSSFTRPREQLKKAG